MDWFTVVFLGLMIAIFYFLLIRPQSKQRKAHQELVSGLSVGDEVLAAGGIVGEITDVSDDWVRLKVANSVEFPVQRSSVHATLPKGTLKEIPAK